ncbi:MULTISPECIES: hypothetical protein [Mycobacteriaceae]|uniref:hypothetical protein n=1 Tax=Mycobacteriaceae TaxID=1762 RepID=UPI00055CE9FB|nr:MULTISPECIES: hypothetical protein [Mycobacteriaceae]AXK77112.1 hypothetical protein DXK33_20455 [Mycolicibacterium neoaurum]KUM10539.1 hypothetical protein AVZ31_02460 [Mycolicibacterium neoaurum]WBP92589.1 hypothetical protein O7W24_15460 [Mycolicibacterium neoaurum]WBS06570.1 hypothetical protein O6072_17005 [Mycolicibacterium neoaurum]
MSALTTYLKIQGQLFVYGIVGPIFLLIYFGATPNNDMKWMYWWGLLITTADVLIALEITDRRTRQDRTARSQAPRLSG